jgi:hypothetical protein
MTSLSSRQIVLVDLQYPYGKKKAYMSGSLCDLTARLLSLEHLVTIIDLNIDDLSESRTLSMLRSADLIGVSVIGSPYIPSAIKFGRFLKHLCPKTPVLLGGQVIQCLSPEQFRELFEGTNAIQMKDDQGLADQLECSVHDLPVSLSVPFAPVWQQMGPERLRKYLQSEFALVIGQGCKYNCNFCAAPKAQRERRVVLTSFRQDLIFLAQQARSFGLAQLECYASSLDFFQNPGAIEGYLHMLAQVRSETGIVFRLRVLSCLGSFLNACDQIPDFDSLLHRSGLWCIGFGSDGMDENVWREENKAHNHFEDVRRCIIACQNMQVQPELLMVAGFEEDGFISSAKNLWYSAWYSFRYGTTIIRPYLAKPFIPGNEGWETETPRVQQTIAESDNFFNLDFCAFGSRLTHPRTLHRWMCNLTYLAIIVALTPFDRCTTSPLFPQAAQGFRGQLAKMINRLMPFDR